MKVRTRGSAMVTAVAAGRVAFNSAKITDLLSITKDSVESAEAARYIDTSS